MLDVMTKTIDIYCYNLTTSINNEKKYAQLNSHQKQSTIGQGLWEAPGPPPDSPIHPPLPTQIRRTPLHRYTCRPNKFLPSGTAVNSHTCPDSWRQRAAPFAPLRAPDTAAFTTKTIMSTRTWT